MFYSLFTALRILIGWIDLAILTVILYLLSFLPKKLLSSWYPKLFQYWCKLFIVALRVNLRCHQIHSKLLPEQYILIGNHPSIFEDVGMPALFDAKFLAKFEVKNWWIVGRIGQAAGTLYVKREDKDNRKEAFQTLLDTLSAGHNIALYPEGGCKGRRIHIPFHHGVFDVALQSGVPVVPVFLHYEAQESFEWQGQHLLVKLWEIITAQNRTANYYVFDPILPSQFESKEVFCEYVENLYLKWQEKYLE